MSEDRPRPHYPPPPPPPAPVVPQVPSQHTGTPEPPYPATPPWQAPTGYPTQPAALATTQPSPHWGVTIISFLCSFIIGAVAMVFSAQVSTKWKAGDVEGALKASQRALVIGIIGIVVGLIVTFAMFSGDTSTGY